jgi:FkbM family methyltransferase
MNEIPEWLQDEVAEYDLDLLVPPKTVLDIGANVGAFTQRARQRWPDAVITAYEPSPDNAADFRKNCPGITLVEAAVRAFYGFDDLRLSEISVSDSFHDLGQKTRGTVIVMCIDAADLPPAEFIKIDAEGCEMEILPRLNLTAAQAVVLEYHRSEATALQKILKDAGFFLVEHRRKSTTEGLLKYARREVLHRPPWLPANPIPDDMQLSGSYPGGKLITLTAGHVRTPFYRDELIGKKLFIGVPVYQEMKTTFVQCLLALQAQKPLPIDIRFAQGDGVARSRNHLTAEFLQTDCTHLLMIDCDLLFSAEHVARIVGHDVPVVGGAYPKKQEGDLEWVINTLPDQSRTPDANGLLPVRYVGTGFICVQRAVFEQMRANYPHSRYRADYGDRREEFDYWPMSVYRKDPADPGRYLSEDWFFCQRWLDLGGNVYLDTQTILKHIGQAVYPLRTQEAEITKPRMENAETLKR